jgi:hypothetical protein
MLRLTLAVLLIVGVAAPALANQDMHPAGRAFFPLWDVRTPTRLTFIVLTRLAYIGQSQDQNQSPEDTLSNCYTFNNDPSKQPGAQVVPVNLEYYDKNCDKVSEVIWMSCADIDIIILSSPANVDIPARNVFRSAALVGGVGALDVHLLDTTNGQPTNVPFNRLNENSLMANAIIVDPTEGWAAAYPAAMAKSTTCPICSSLDGGAASPVGYEPYPREVFIPAVFADGTRAGGGGISNFLALWAPTLLPGTDMDGSFSVALTWWDGRERPFQFNDSGHNILENLSTIDDRFHVDNFVCGHTGDPNVAENDGSSRGDNGGVPTSLNCDPLRVTNAADTAHQSDNFDQGGTTSRPVGWWDIVMTSDSQIGPLVFPGLSSGRGLAGVLLSSGTGGESGKGVGEALRLWHKDPCEVGPQGFPLAWGPPHLRDHGVLSNNVPDPQELMVFFNVFNFGVQDDICRGFFVDD